MLRKFLIVYSLILVFFISKGEEKRDILIGDLINLKLSGNELTEEFIREKFKEFEIEKIENKENSFILSFRSFETGEKNIKIGNKNIKIIVKSSITENEKDIIEEIKEVDTNNPKIIKRPFPITYVLIFLVVLIVLSFILWIVKILIYRHNKRVLTPYEYFQREIWELKIEDEKYFSIMTLALKRFIENEYGVRIFGKTSSEMIEEIRKIKNINFDMDRLIKWLEFSDMCKYAGYMPSNEEKIKQKEEIVNLCRERL